MAKEIKDTQQFATEDQLRQHLLSCPQVDLVEMLMVVATRLAYDEFGGYNPEESLAADSGADYIEAVKWIFWKNQIEM